jgi:hypothetical protein
MVHGTFSSAAPNDEGLWSIESIVDRPWSMVHFPRQRRMMWGYGLSSMVYGLIAQHCLTSLVFTSFRCSDFVGSCMFNGQLRCAMHFQLLKSNLIRKSLACQQHPIHLNYLQSQRPRLQAEQSNRENVVPKPKRLPMHPCIRNWL